MLTFVFLTGASLVLTGVGLMMISYGTLEKIATTPHFVPVIEVRREAPEETLKKEAQEKEKGC